MHEPEKKYRITYDSWEGHYVVHTPKGEVNFHKNKQGLPYIELDGPTGCEAAVMLLQSMQQEHRVCVRPRIRKGLFSELALPVLVRVLVQGSASSSMRIHWCPY